MIKSIAVVWLPVSNMDRAVAFYRDSLGLEVAEREGGWTEVTAGGQVIGLNSGESPAGEGGAVIAFAVDDVEKASAELRERGVKFSGEVSKHPWGEIAPFKDPDGNDLQLFASA